MSIFTILFVVLLIAWLMGFTVFHVANRPDSHPSDLAVILFVLHFVSRRPARGIVSSLCLRRSKTKPR